MSDFDADDSDGFLVDDDAVAADRPLGLVTPIPARVLRDKAGRVIFDELVYLEEAYRRMGGLPVTFYGEDWEPEVYGGPVASRKGRG